MRVALVHDYLKEYGGAERVLEALMELFPQAPLYVAYYNPEGLGKHAIKFAKAQIYTSWLQKVPFAKQLVSPLRILAPLMFESFDLNQYDLVISSSSIYFAKAVLTKPPSLHLAYIHTPPRYLYGYTTSFNYKKHVVTRIGAEIMNHFLRLWDFIISQRPDVLIANSHNVASRIKKFYRRQALVVYPPVEVKKIMQSLGKKDYQKEYFLALSRLWKGKGVDLIIKACTQLNFPLKVVGTGPELASLQQLAGEKVEFLGHLSDDQLPQVYARAKALVIAAEDEDFGITAVEAQAAGTPVIAPRSGGFLESIVDGKTGSLYQPVNLSTLKQILSDFDPTRFRKEDCQRNAQRFTKEKFQKNILKLIKQLGKK